AEHREVITVRVYIGRTCDFDVIFIGRRNAVTLEGVIRRHVRVYSSRLPAHARPARIVLSHAHFAGGTAEGILGNDVSPSWTCADERQRQGEKQEQRANTDR